MKTLFVYFNQDGFIRSIEKHILEAMDELSFSYEHCYIEDYPKIVEEFEPIMTIFFHPNSLIYKFTDIIQNQKGHKLLWDMESPYESDIPFDMLPYIHYMFISDEATVEELKKKTPSNQIYYVPHACAPKIHRPISRSEIPWEYRSDYILIGNAYRSRIKWLADNVELFKDDSLTVIGIGYWGIEGYSNQRFIRRHVSEEECVLYYNGARKVLNLHRMAGDLDMSNKRNIEPRHLNNRFYEVAAMGKEQIIVGRDSMLEEAKRVQGLDPNEYSYVARLKKYLVPILG